MITFTPNAAQKAKSLLAKAGKPQAALRLRVLSSGCAGLEYKLEPDDNPPKSNDKVYESQGVKIYTDPQGSLYVDGTEIDYVQSLMNSGFKYKNPNSVTECSCGESFTV